PQLPNAGHGHRGLVHLAYSHLAVLDLSSKPARLLWASLSKRIVSRGQEIQLARSEAPVHVVAGEQSGQVVSVGRVRADREQVEMAVILVFADLSRQGGHFVSDLGEQ